MKKSLLITYGIVSALVFTIFFANIDTVGGYFDSLFNTGIQNFLSQADRIYFYILKLLIYFFSFLWAQRKFSQIPLFTFLCIITPLILIDATVFIDGKNLIPLRFPFETFFPILGAGGALLKTVSTKKYFILYVFFTCFFVFFSKTFFIPEIINLIEKRDSRKIINSSPFGHGYLHTVRGDSLRLEDTATSKALIVEYYFVGCAPCELKLKFLEQLSIKVNSTDFKIFLICNGSISSYKSFVAHAMKNASKEFSFLYDNSGIIKKTTNAEGYPYEMMLDKNRHIISVLLGFNAETAVRYVSDNHKKIIRIINE